MKPYIPISVIQFTYQAIDSITMPAYCGTLWHSVLGRALREQSCIAPNLECKQCMLLHQCDFPYLFHRWAPPESQMMRGKEVPVPHIIGFDDSAEQLIKAGDEFTANLVLVGRASQKMLAMTRAMFSAGIAGLGKNRSSARFKNAKQVEPNGVSTMIWDQGRFFEEVQPQHPNQPDPPATIRLSFCTPYKPPGKYQENVLDVGHFLMAIVRRISLMQYFYTSKRLEADFQQLKALTETVSISEKNLHWIRPNRPYFVKHGQDVDISGWTGTFEIQMEPIQELWPYLWLGQWLGVGKKASMGFGRYRIIGMANDHC